MAFIALRLFARRISFSSASTTYTNSHQRHHAPHLPIQQLQERDYPEMDVGLLTDNLMLPILAYLSHSSQRPIERALLVECIGGEYIREHINILLFPISRNKLLQTDLWLLEENLAHCGEHHSGYEDGWSTDEITHIGRVSKEATI